MGKYTELQMELILLSEEDVIRTSPDIDYDDNETPGVGLIV